MCSKEQKKLQSVFNVNVNQSDSIGNNFSSRIPPSYPDYEKFTFLKQSDYDTMCATSYQLTIDIPTLINSSRKTRRAIKFKKIGEGKPPRPQNAFVIYRRDT